MQEIRLSNADCANALLRGEIDVNQYWRKSGEQQVKSAGVFLTQQQQDRALKHLARLALNLRTCAPRLLESEPSGRIKAGHVVVDDDLQCAFIDCLATYR